MSDLLLALGVTLLAGTATIVGGVVATHGRLRSGGGLAACLAFAAGAMVTVSVAEIVPKGVESLGHDARAVWVTLALLALGAALVLLVQRLVPRAADVPEAGPRGYATGGDQMARLRRSGVVVALVVAGHNLPEGLATFVATLDDPTTGIAIAVAIAIHNVPEGVAVAAPVQAATGSRSKAVLYAAGSGLAEPLGGVLGYFLLAAVLPEAAMGAVFGLIAGMMIQISLSELLPAARRIAGAWVALAGAVAGGAVMALSLVLLGVG